MGKTAAKTAIKRSASETRGGVVKKSAGVVSNNIFNTLKDNDAGNPLANLKQRKEKPASIGQPPELKEKYPPVFVHGDPPDLRPDLRKLIATKGLKCTFRLCTEGVKLMTEGKAHYEMVLQYLDAKKYQFYTHDIPGSKPMKVVLRGLDDVDVEEVKEGLRYRGLKPTDVFKIARRNTTLKYRDQLYLVHLERGSTTMKELQTVRAINDTIVEWQRYKPVHRDVTQCMNCLRFGHGTKNCCMATRCERCAENHGVGECDRMEDSDPKCANCGEKHLATTKACKKRAEFLEIRKRASTKNAPKKNTPSAPAVTQQSFPNLPQSRRPIPNLPPLQPHRRLAAAAASGPPETSSTQAPPATSCTQCPPPPPPGYRQQQETDQVSDPLPPEDANPLYTGKELASLFNQLVAILRSCKTRFEQIHRLGLFAIEHGY